MATKRPLAVYNGVTKEIQSGDTIPTSVIPNYAPMYVVATYATINTSGMSTPCFFTVQTDETNSSTTTLYFFNGSALTWIPTQHV